jgi:DNA-binding transcriptional ArsR family regulator
MKMSASVKGGARGAGLGTCAVGKMDPGRVAAARKELLSAGDADELAACFRLLGDPKRVRILYALLEAGELCVCDIAATTEVPETTVSQAMRLLRTAGIVRNRREGRTVYYRLDDAHVRLLLDVSKEHVVHEGAVKH